MSEPSFERFERDGWRGRVRSDWAARLAEGDRLADLLTPTAELARDRPAVRVWRKPIGEACVYVKHSTAGKSGRSDKGGVAERIDRAKWVLRGSRALRVMRVHAELERVGIPVPAVLLAARRHSGLSAEDVLVTEEVVGENLRWRMNREIADDELIELLHRAGRTMAELHRRGFIHGDMLSGNMILRPDGRLVLIDNERTRRPTALRFDALRRLNLAQMVSRLLPEQSYASIRHMLDAYYDSMAMGMGERRTEQSRVLRQARARRARIDADHKAAGRRRRVKRGPAHARRKRRHPAP